MGKSWLIEGKAMFKVLMQSSEVGKQRRTSGYLRGGWCNQDSLTHPGRLVSYSGKTGLSLHKLGQKKVPTYLTLNLQLCQENDMASSLDTSRL